MNVEIAPERLSEAKVRVRHCLSHVVPAQSFVHVTTVCNAYTAFLHCSQYLLLFACLAVDNFTAPNAQKSLVIKKVL